MNDHILPIIIAFVAYSCVDVGKAMQKYGLTIRSQRPKIGALVWIIGTAGTSVSSLLVLWAVSIGSVVVVGSMAGTGLVAATFFAVLILHESLRPRDIIAIGLVLIGPFALGSISMPAIATQIAVERLGLFAAVLAIAYSIALKVAPRLVPIHGILVASAAGVVSGFVVMFQKLASSEMTRPLSWLSIHIQLPWLDTLIHLFMNPFAVTWIVLSIFSTIVLQLSYESANTVRIIPAFNSSSILTVILGGVVVFGERLHILQWLGVVTILSGVALLTLSRDSSETV